ncbi:Charged multivesicular body protein 7 [Monocercomonoides exilis]|uniref:Charged multivesicular body protein 7 n=1 Tax=Monocercomonoides exilis TaxID=2049356 RepID=UPI00355A61F9|nr:Charged multivesicular body protein 7 [Monocercomonoides exilis]
MIISSNQREEFLKTIPNWKDDSKIMLYFTEIPDKSSVDPEQWAAKWQYRVDFWKQSIQSLWKYFSIIEINEDDITNIFSRGSLKPMGIHEILKTFEKEGILVPYHNFVIEYQSVNAVHQLESDNESSASPKQSWLSTLIAAPLKWTLAALQWILPGIKKESSENEDHRYIVIQNLIDCANKLYYNYSSLASVPSNQIISIKQIKECPVISQNYSCSLDTAIQKREGMNEHKAGIDLIKINEADVSQCCELSIGQLMKEGKAETIIVNEPKITFVKFLKSSSKEKISSSSKSSHQASLSITEKAVVRLKAAIESISEFQLMLGEQRKQATARLHEIAKTNRTIGLSIAKTKLTIERRMGQNEQTLHNLQRILLQIDSAKTDKEVMDVYGDAEKALSEAIDMLQDADKVADAVSSRMEELDQIQDDMASSLGGKDLTGSDNLSDDEIEAMLNELIAEDEKGKEKAKTDAANDKDSAQMQRKIEKSAQQPGTQQVKTPTNEDNLTKEMKQLELAV